MPQGAFRVLQVRGSRAASIVVSLKLDSGEGWEVLIFLLSVLLVGKVITVARVMMLWLLLLSVRNGPGRPGFGEAGPGLLKFFRI